MSVCQFSLREIVMTLSRFETEKDIETHFMRKLPPLKCNLTSCFWGAESTTAGCGNDDTVASPDSNMIASFHFFFLAV